jgi:ketosteroid isomerase-like protein
MSHENVEVVRACWETFGREGQEAMIRNFAHPQIKWRVRSDLPDAATYQGHDGLRRLFARFEEVFEEQGYEPQDFVDAGDSVVVPLRWWGRGRGSGVTATERFETWVFTVRERSITKVEEFATRAEALEAVGLRE